MNTPAELETLRDFLRYTVSRFNQAGLAFGHGSANAYDEAAYLLLHTLRLPLDRLEPFLDAKLTAAERSEFGALLARRIDERVPAAYLTHEAWLGEFRFHVDERVLIRRSIFARARGALLSCSRTRSKTPTSTRSTSVPTRSPSRSATSATTDLPAA